MKQIILRACFFIFFFLGASPYLFSKELNLLPTSLPIPDSDHLSTFVHVAVVTHASDVALSIDGPYQLNITKKFSHDEDHSLTKPLQATLRPHERGILVNEKLYETKRIVFHIKDGFITVNKRTYKNEIQILKKNGTLFVVNHIDVDEYLKGVLPLEVHPDWPLESLKAHAVVSRTFALFKSIEKKDEDFALVNTVLSQVYGGALFHKKSTDQAVRETKGQILTSAGKIFPSYFYACCGGQTAQGDQIWLIEPNPVLKSVECLFCKNTKHWSWTLVLPLKEIENRMQQKGYPAKNLQNILFVDRDISGRATRVILKYKLSELSIRADEFRAFIGYDRLRSLKANVMVKGRRAHFSGRGWGHGIGFCQWGSKGQAEEGKTFQHILQYYFPGSKIKKIY